MNSTLMDDSWICNFEEITTLTQSQTIVEPRPLVKNNNVAEDLESVEAQSEI